jgi:hypothetical protein
MSTSAAGHPRARIRPELLTRLGEGFAEASSGRAIQRRVTIAGRQISLEFAGREMLEAIYPALSHLETQKGGDLALTIRLWDSASSGTPPPVLPWSASDVTTRGGVSSHTDPRVRLRHDPVSGLVAAYDESTHEAVWWFPDAHAIPWVERSSPLREILAWSLAGPRTPLLHAAAIGGREGGVLLSGPSGAGKSVTALAALASGMRYAGDDHMLVSLDPEPVAHSLYRLARVHGADMDRIAVLQSALVGWVDGAHVKKAVIDACRIQPAAVAGRLELSALVFPQPTTGGRTRIRRITAAEALRRMAPSTIFLIAQEPRGLMAAMGELVRRLPAYSLELSGDPTRAAHELQALCGGA